MNVKSILFLRVLLMFTMLPLAATTALAAAVGMVTDLTGKAWAVAGTSRQPLAILAYLEPGTVVEVDKGGNVSITFYSPSQEQVFSGPAKFRIELRGITRISGGAPAVLGVGVLAAEATSRELAQGGRRTQAAVRMRSLAVGAAITGLSPDKTAVRGTTPLFSWTALAEAGKYRVSLATPEGVALADETVTDKEWRLPADKALTPGREYVWTVEAMLASGKKVAGAGRFSVLDSDTQARLAAEAPTDRASFAQRVRHALALETAGLANDARDLWRELAKERPDEPAVRKRAQP